MAETPRNTPDGQNSPSKARSAYLPALPEGWHYQVQVHGPDGQQVSVGPDRWADGIADGPHMVTVHVVKDGNRRALQAASLAEGVKKAVTAVKALAKLNVQRAELRAAESAVFEALDGAGALYGPGNAADDDDSESEPAAAEVAP